jgi:hypothetical protein
MELGFITGLWWPHIARRVGGFDGCDCLRDPSFPLLCIFCPSLFPWLPRAVNDRARSPFVAPPSWLIFWVRLDLLFQGS